MTPGPHWREAGAGPCVLCLHSFASNSGQYRGLMERLAPRFRVVAADLYGHGENASWPGDRPLTLTDEAAPLEALLAAEPFVDLVGHSYGAAVALRIAEAGRIRVRSMVLYEPTLWGTLAQLCPGEPATLEIEAVRDDTVGLIGANRLEAAANRFLDYWAGTGAWAATPHERRPRLVATMRSLPAAWSASFNDRWSIPALRALDLPCLLLTGARSTAAARRAIRLLRETVSGATLVEFDGLGHLGPIADPQRVIDATEAFLVR